MERYSHGEIEKNLGDSLKKKHTECDVLPLSELKKLLEDGWVIYDTNPMLNNDNVKILTLVKG